MAQHRKHSDGRMYPCRLQMRLQTISNYNCVADFGGIKIQRPSFAVQLSECAAASTSTHQEDLILVDDWPEVVLATVCAVAIPCKSGRAFPIRAILSVVDVGKFRPPSNHYHVSRQGHHSMSTSGGVCRGSCRKRPSPA